MSRYYETQSNDSLIKDMFFGFKLFEFTTDRSEVINAIQNKKFITDTKEFYKSYKQAKHSKMLTQYSESDFRKMHTYKLEGYNIGFALKKFGSYGYSEIVAVHNAEPDIKAIGDYLIEAIIDTGGLYLDHFDGMLSNLYSRAGFIEYKREAYNPEYDPDGSFAKEYGKPDIIYRRHKSAPVPKI